MSNLTYHVNTKDDCVYIEQGGGFSPFRLLYMKACRYPATVRGILYSPKVPTGYVALTYPQFMGYMGRGNEV